MTINYRLHHVGYLSPNLLLNRRLLIDGLDQQILVSRPGYSVIGSGTDLLLEWFDGTHLPVSTADTRSGLHHISFAVNDVAVAYSELIGLECRSVWEPTAGPMGMTCGLLDDSGVVIELIREDGFKLPPAPPQTPIPFNIHHVNILTDDWRRTRDFYQTHFGLRVVMEYVDEHDGAFLFLADRYFDSKSHNVLLEITGPPYAEQREHDFFAKHGAGLDHICYTAADVDGAWQRLIDTGARNLSEPYDAWGTRLAWVKDFDGNDIELILPIPEDAFD